MYANKTESEQLTALYLMMKDHIFLDRIPDDYIERYGDDHYAPVFDKSGKIIQGEKRKFLGRWVGAW